VSQNSITTGADAPENFISWRNTVSAYVDWEGWKQKKRNNESRAGEKRLGDDSESGDSDSGGAREKETYELEGLVVIKEKTLDELRLADGRVPEQNDLEVRRALGERNGLSSLGYAAPAGQQKVENG
jgi:hypothetical protein